VKDETVDFDVARDIALSLPGVEDATTPRGFSVKLHGKLLACKATHKSAEPNTLMVRVSKTERDRLIAEHSDSFYVTTHYLSYPAVLVRLDTIEPGTLLDALKAAWVYQAEQQ